MLAKNRADSNLIKYQFALSKQELGDYAEVIRAADEYFQSSRLEQTSDPADEFKLEENLFKWRRLRARAFTKCAERLRDEGSDGARAEAVKHIKSAFEDLGLCSKFTEKYNHLLDMHSIERVRAEAWMTRVDLDIDRRAFAAARRDIEYARKALQRYGEICRIVDRFYEVDKYHERFNGIDARLRREDPNKAGDAAKSTGT
jgi:hypothetical protein